MTVETQPSQEETQMPNAAAPNAVPQPTLKVTAIADFKGDLPARTGPKVREPSPYDPLLATLVAEAAKDPDHRSGVKLAKCNFADKEALKPLINELRRALDFTGTKDYGLKTWPIEGQGLAFQVGPKTIRKPAETNGNANATAVAS